MPAPASHPSREESAARALRRGSHAPERPPAEAADAAGPLTPSQARALRQQARAAGLLMPRQERAVRQAALQHSRGAPPRCDTAATADPAPSVAQPAAAQDELLRHLVSVDFAADSDIHQMAPIARADYNISSRRGPLRPIYLALCI
jgi:hypothetical protein